MPAAEATVRLGLRDLVGTLEGVRRQLSELAERLPPDPPGEEDVESEDPLWVLRAAIECAVDHLQPAIQALAAEAVIGQSDALAAPARG